MCDLKDALPQWLSSREWNSEGTEPGSMCYKFIKQSPYMLKFENSYNRLNLLLLYHDLHIEMSQCLLLEAKKKKGNIRLLDKNQGKF